MEVEYKDRYTGKELVIKAENDNERDFLDKLVKETEIDKKKLWINSQLASSQNRGYCEISITIGDKDDS